MDSSLEELKKFGIGASISKALEMTNSSMSEGSYLYENIRTVIGNGVLTSAYSRLLTLDTSLGNLLRTDHAQFALEKFNKLLTDVGGRDSKVDVLTKSAAELMAAGILISEFTSITPIKETSNKTPDFSLEKNSFAEVYCPLRSETEELKVSKKFEEQTGPIKLVISYPITGSGGSALQFQTNKTIDRVLDSKRKKDQTVSHAENILWLDLLNGFDIKSSDLRPYITANKCELTFFGSFGVWHALYGLNGKSVLCKDRTVLRYLQPEIDCYLQQKSGLFRERKSLSGALLLVSDGLVLFENPWATVPLSIETKRRVRNLFRFRPEFSYFSCAGPMSSIEIDSVLTKIEWLLS